MENIRQTALAACIGSLAENGQLKTAARAAQPLFANTDTPAPLRVACAKVLLLADDDFFVRGIKDPCPLVRQTVIRAADEVSLKTLVAALKTTVPTDQVALIAKLAARDAKDCAMDVAVQLASDQEPVVCEALRALTKIGHAEQIATIYTLALRDDAVGRTATEALNDFQAPGSGETLIALALKDVSQQPKILTILGKRTEIKLLPKLDSFLQSDNADVRKEAWKTVGKTASEETLALLVSWLPLVQDTELNQAESAIRTVARNVAPATRATAFTAAWDKASTVTSKKILSGLMSTYADPSFVAPLSSAISDPDKVLSETALRALADWSSMDPYPVLKNAFTTQTDSDLKTTALRSVLKVVSANAGADMRIRLIELFKLAPDERSRMTVANVLFKFDGLELFTVLQELFNDTTCGAAAKTTYTTFFDTKIKDHGGVASGVIDVNKWTANASHNGRESKKAFDRNPSTRWSSNACSEKGMWFTLDLGESVFIAEVLLDTENSPGDTPNGYEVFTSEDGKNWGGAVTQGNDPTRGKTTIPLAIQTRYLKFVTTGGRAGLHWSIHEIYVKPGLDQKKIAHIKQVADSIR